MSNTQDLNIKKIQNSGDNSNIRGVFVSFLFKIILFVIFINYLYSLFFGDSSIGVMLDAKEREKKIEKEYNSLLNENQKLQKKHFELIQLTPEES